MNDIQQISPLRLMQLELSDQATSQYSQGWHDGYIDSSEHDPDCTSFAYIKYEDSEYIRGYENGWQAAQSPFAISLGSS